MCMSATCSDCSKKAWRGCGKHIPSAMAGVDEADWCTCEPRVEVAGRTYPRAAPSAGAPSAVAGAVAGRPAAGPKGAAP